MTNFIKHLFLLIFLAGFLSNCDGECEDGADLFVPNFINGQLLVKGESKPCFIGPNFFPNGTPIFLTNTVNEFYSVERFDPNLGTNIVLYWNFNSPPPIQFGAPAPFYPIQPGETIKVYKVVANIKPPDFDCLLNDASTSKTKMQVTVKVEDGSIVSTTDQTKNTPSIPAGGYALNEFSLVFTQNGIYELEFEANTDRSVPEIDFDNNTFIERPLQDMGTQ